MKSLFRIFWTLFVGGVACFSACLASAQIVSEVNPSKAITAVGGGDSYEPILSSNGRYVVFASSANNLSLTGDGHAFAGLFPPPLNVFLRDRQTGITKLVSVSASGTATGNGDSFPSGVSDDGRYVCFESAASNLISAATNAGKNIFVRDMSGEATMLVSIATNGASGNGESREAAMTPDGRYVTFVSAASNLIANDTNGIPDVFVRDLQLGVTTVASVGAVATTNAQNAALGTMGSASEWPSISSDGRYVAFYSTAMYLLPGLTNVGEIFLHDTVSNTTVWVSTNAHSFLSAPVSVNYAMTPDGQYIAYYASQTTPNTTNGMVFRYHASTATTDVAATNGFINAAFDLGERSVDISADGNSIAFVETNGGDGAIEYWNAQTGVTLLISGGATNAVCAFPRLNASGRYVAFLSDEGLLATNSDSTLHLYLRDTVGGGLQMVDGDSSGRASFGSVSQPMSVSAAGNIVAWSAPDGTFAPSARKLDVFARDLTANSTQVISSAAPPLGSLTAFGSSEIDPGCVSSNGQIVVFSSDADGLSPNDTNGFSDVYAHNLVTGSNVLVSVSADGSSAGNGQSFSPAISADGRFVIFASAATNLVVNDTNGAIDIFVRDLQSNTTALVSVDAAGSGEGNADSSLPSISADGHFALFTSLAGNLVTNPLPSKDTALLWRDLRQGVTLPVSLGGTVAAVLTPNGSNVLWEDTAFGSTSYGYVWQASSQTSTKLATSPQAFVDMFVTSNGKIAAFGSYTQVYIVNISAGSTVVITNLSGPPQFRYDLSGDGRFLVALTVVSRTNQVYLYDLTAGTNALISRAYNGSGAGDGACDSPAISPDGRYIAYRSHADNIVPGDSNSRSDIFLYDRFWGVTTLVSASQSGNQTANGLSLSPVFSPDIQTLFFKSWSSDIATNDFNQAADIFAVALSAGSPVASSNSVPPLGFTGISFNAAGGGSGVLTPMLTWPASFGTGYQVQFKNDLADPDWQNLQDPATVVGRQGSVVDSSTNVIQRFYRIVSF